MTGSFLRPSSTSAVFIKKGDPSFEKYLSVLALSVSGGQDLLCWRSSVLEQRSMQRL